MDGSWRSQKWVHSESVVASVLLRWLAPFVDENRLGRVVAETLFLLDPASGLKRRPDLAFVSTNAGLLAVEYPEPRRGMSSPTSPSR